METFKKVAKWYENSLAGEHDLARKAAHDQRVAAQNKSIQDLIATANEQRRYEGGDGFELPKMAEKLYPEPTRAELKRLRDELAALDEVGARDAGGDGRHRGPGRRHAYPGSRQPSDARPDRPETRPAGARRPRIRHASARPRAAGWSWPDGSPPPTTP